MVLSVIGGTLLGMSVFFFGMLLMNRSVTALSGVKLKKYIEKSTSNPVLGMISGMFITALIHSSSGTTVMVVSLVNSGAMNLYQATAVIMGANIGTTFTGQLISFNFFSVIPKLLFLGVLLYAIRLTYVTKYIGKFLIGFSSLFLGIQLMIIFLDPLRNMMEFRELILSVGNYKMKGVTLGALTTAIIQSSSTSIAILQGLAHKGLIDIYCASPIILGLNMGTCSTTLISSIAADKNGKRAALIHLIFNIFGVLIFYQLIDLFSKFIYLLTPYNTVKQISNFHSLFNVVSTILLFPFIPLIVNLSKKIIR